MKHFQFLFILLSATPHLLAHPICCSYLQGNKIINEQFYGPEKAEFVCAAQEQKLLHPSRRLLKSSQEKCHPSLLNEYLSEVEVCYAPTTFSNIAPQPLGKILDLSTSAFKIRHSWIRTPNLEAGQGPRAKNPVFTQWTDHSGAGDKHDSRCFPVAGCDVRCVEQHMQTGKFTGLYGALNTCHDLVVRVFTACGCLNTCLNPRTHGPQHCAAWTFPPLGHADRLGLLPR